MEGNVQGIRSIIGKHKIDRGRLRTCRKWRSQRTYIYDPWTGPRRGDAGRIGGAGQRGIKRRKNVTSVIASSIKKY